MKITFQPSATLHIKRSVKNYRLLPLILFLLCSTQSHAQVSNTQSNLGDISKLMQLSYAELDSLVEIPYKKGDYKKAMLYMQAGREKAKNEFTISEKAIQDSIYGEYTANLAFFYGELGQYEQALILHLEAKKIIAKSLGIEHSSYASSLNNLANLYRSMGQYEQALPLYLQAKNIRAKSLGTEHPSYATSLNNLAALYKSMGQYEQALPLYLQASSGFAKSLGVEHPFYANSVNNLALLYYEIGQYEQALPLYIQAKNIRAKSLGTEHHSYGTSLNNLAALYQQMGQHEEALPLFIEAKDLEAKSLGTEHPNYANSLNNLAIVYQSMGQYEQALTLFLQAKEIRAKSLGIEHHSYATSLNTLAALYQSMGQHEQALTLFLQAKEIRARSLGIEHPYYAASLNNLVELYVDLGQYHLAWEIIPTAIHVSSKLTLNISLTNSWADSIFHANYSSNSHREQMIETLRLIYKLLEKDHIKKSKTSQIIVSDLAAALLVQLRNNHGSNDDKLRMLSKSSDWLLKSLEVLDKKKDANKAFEKAEQNKSVLLLESYKSEKAYQLSNLPDSLIRKEQTLIKKRDKLQANLLEKRAETEKDSLTVLLNKVNQDLNNFSATIEKDYPQYAAFKYKQEYAKTADIQKKLDHNTALLEYVIGDSVLHIFYIDQNGLRWIEKTLDTKELTKKIKTLHGVLSDYKMATQKTGESYKIYTETAHWFYQNLIEPAIIDAKDITDVSLRIKNLILVTDGELGHLPFESFLVEPAPQSQTEYSKLHYLLNDFSISYNYSATLWKENKEAPKAQNNGQIFGFASNYNIALDSTMKEVRLPTYQDLRGLLNPLPAARKEVELLAQNYNGFFAFDSLASEKNFKEKAGDYAIIHLAMHGLLDNKRPVLSSLAFTEDSDSLQDNFLQAHEISKLELNADLVILSACETGYGKFEKGNGIASLARAFMFAGASSLVVSLWQVNDFATSELMKHFYQNLVDGMEKDVALQQAKLEYIKNAKGVLAHPAFWSPFIQIGNTQSVYLEKRHAFSLLWIVGGLVLMGLIGGLILKNRNKMV